MEAQGADLPSLAKLASGSSLLEPGNLTLNLVLVLEQTIDITLSTEGCSFPV